MKINFRREITASLTPKNIKFRFGFLSYNNCPELAVAEVMKSEARVRGLVSGGVGNSCKLDFKYTFRYAGQNFDSGDNIFTTLFSELKKTPQTTPDKTVENPEIARFEENNAVFCNNSANSWKLKNYIKNKDKLLDPDKKSRVRGQKKDGESFVFRAKKDFFFETMELVLPYDYDQLVNLREILHNEKSHNPSFDFDIEFVLTEEECLQMMADTIASEAELVERRFRSLGTVKNSPVIAEVAVESMIVNYPQDIKTKEIDYYCNVMSLRPVTAKLVLNIVVTG